MTSSGGSGASLRVVLECFQLQQEDILPRLFAGRRPRIGAERFLPVRREEHPAPVGRDVGARRVPEGGLRRRPVPADVAAVAREAPDVGAPVSRDCQDLVVPRAPLDAVGAVAVGRRHEWNGAIGPRVVPGRMVRQVDLFRHDDALDHVAGRERRRQRAPLPLRRVPGRRRAAVLVDAGAVAERVVPARARADERQGRRDVGQRVPDVDRRGVARRGAVRSALVG